MGTKSNKLSFKIERYLYVFLIVILCLYLLVLLIIHVHNFYIDKEVETIVIEKLIERNSMGSDPVSMNDIYELIFAGLGFIFAISLILPEIMIRRIVETQVNEAMEKVNVEFVQTYKDKLAVHTNMLDAHTSRMVAYLLSKNDDVEDKLWSIGWAIRSIKNYVRIIGQENPLGEELSQKKYEELIRSPIEYITNSFNEMNQITTRSSQNLSDYLNVNSASNTSLCIRTCKEMFDVCFMLHVNPNNLSRFDLSASFSAFLENNETKCLLSQMIDYLYNHTVVSRFANLTPIKRLILIQQEVIEKSNYSHDENYRHYVVLAINHFLRYPYQSIDLCVIFQIKM